MGYRIRQIYLRKQRDIFTESDRYIYRIRERYLRNREKDFQNKKNLSTDQERYINRIRKIHFEGLIQGEL